MSQAAYRTEKDSMGEMKVPDWALWGASTQRAVENFPISGRGIPAEVVHAFGLLKAACAQVNKDLGKLEPTLANAIIDASNEVAQGKHDKHFVVDVYQTGSGTSSNMNANEVIANIVSQKAGKGIGSKEPAHPNDHVNMGQSSNDTFPAAMHIAAAVAIKQNLEPAALGLQKVLDGQAKDWDQIVKIGRTHLMDATPIRVGQVFSGYASAVDMWLCNGAKRSFDEMRTNMPIWGTAVGTGINTHVEFGQRVCGALSKSTGVNFEEAVNHPESQSAKGSFVQASGNLKSSAVALSKIANDIRWLGSGPRCGIFELSLPEIQPGSSIMPGKVNPVICESVIQVAARVIANDAAVTYGGFGGVGSIMELNVAMPLIADAIMDSINLLANVSNVFVDKLLSDLVVNQQRCTDLIDQSLMMVTSLAPKLGYDNAAKLAKQAFTENKTIRQLVQDQNLMEAKELDTLLDPRAMTQPGVD
ncbi:MAG: aspartate ammonia-lyase [Phycisphaeraceae bacterium]|nr:aspartate ammonia-lyase [Phycisphaeraceae bacterium]